MKTILSAKSTDNTIKISSPEMKELKPSPPPSGYGQLPVDVFESSSEILVVAPLAGVDLDKAEIVINNDVLTIRGKREIGEEASYFKKGDYYVQECFWGEFSRSIILPPDIQADGVEATQKNHILYIRIPKRMNIRMKIVKIKTS